MQWPDYYPEDCPPKDAKPAIETVYRLVKHEPPQAEDFLSSWEEFLGRFPEPTIKNSGISVYTDPEDIPRLFDRLKNRIGHLRNRKTAKGKLNPTLGRIQHTPSHENSHHTWWKPIGVEPWFVFEVINE